MPADTLSANLIEHLLRPDRPHSVAELDEALVASASVGSSAPTIVARVASRQELVRNAILRHAGWIETFLACCLGDAVILNFEFSLSQLAVACILPGCDLRSDSPVLKALQAQIDAVQLPPDLIPILACERVRDPHSSFAQSRTLWSATWADGPALLRFKTLSGPIIVVRVPTLLGGHEPSHQDVVITARATAIELLRLIDGAGAQSAPPSLCMAPGYGQPILPCHWDELVLDPTILQLVREDFDTFFDREKWFHSNHLPFRRGYLLYGPPGNGKSSVIRAMMTGRNLDGYTVRFFHHQTDDSDLEQAFKYAADAAPALVVLEDIDRAFPRAGQPRCHISLHQLLNSLDGVASQEGVIVVATANDPTALDPAILKRPGRFDRVVCFPLPTVELRRTYFRKLHPALRTEELIQAAVASEGFSFAQLREAYILAGQLAFGTASDIGGDDLLRGIATLRRGTQIAARRAQQVGFGGRPAASSQPTSINAADVRIG